MVGRTRILVSSRLHARPFFASAHYLIRIYICICIGLSIPLSLDTSMMAPMVGVASPAAPVPAQDLNGPMIDDSLFAVPQHKATVRKRSEYYMDNR